MRARVFEGLERGLRRMARRNRTLRRLRERLRGGRQRAHLEISDLRARLVGGGGVRPGVRTGVRPENVVWIFGSGRSGSTWLRSMMGELRGHRVWEEPMVGKLFGEFYDKAPSMNRRSADFIMGNPIRKGWIRSIRSFVLDGAGYSHPGLGAEDYLIVKEPNGSAGAPLLMEALPESRMILLVRDPRDVVASVLDAAREGGWLYESRDENGKGRRGLADRRPDAFVKRRARAYSQSVGNAKRAYDSHRGPKALIRYEDLVADTLGTLERVYAALGIPAENRDLARAVDRYSWENIPEGEKGGGKFYRKASTGGWRLDLTPKQARAVERTTASLLREFYPES